VVTYLNPAEGPTAEFIDIKNKKVGVQVKQQWGDAITDIAFDGRCKLIATVTKDKRVRVVDPREQKTLAEISPAECERDTRVWWNGYNRLLIFGFASGGRRQVSLYDLERPEKPLATQLLESNNATIIPHFDDDTGVIFVGNNGGSFIQLYLVTATAPYIESMNVFMSAGDVTGHAFAHKTTCDIKKVELAHSFKLSRDKIIPISWTLPRKRLEFFQDDVFPATRSAVAAMTAAEWIAGGDKEPEFISLQPAGMVELSKAPKEEMTERQKRYQEHLLAQQKAKPKGILGHESASEVRDHFRGIAKALPGGNRWDAKVDDSKVDVDENEWE